ncbi:MAG: hypothetical protein VR64_12300 [Desulfatitalea sp. BRH_c12]|nr:MAG: hypothetical protein VR64_12300 [Desulfatitalea sp. BRH_c12]
MASGHNIPLFFRLYHKLKQDITRGEIPRGARLDSIGVLAQRYGVSQSSVRKSLDLLESEGLLVRKQGWGTSVPKDLELYFFDLGKVINSRRTFDEMSRAEIRINDCQWVDPNHRIRYSLYCDDTAPELRNKPVFKIDSWISFPGKFKFKALITYYFPEGWLSANGVCDKTPARDILLCMSRWVLSTTMNMQEALLPFICTDETAALLELPDGTPVFHHTVGIKDRKDKISCCWEMISTANLFFREMVLN